MHPFSYTGVKIIHDEQVKEAMERQKMRKERKKYSPLRRVEQPLPRVQEQRAQRKQGSAFSTEAKCANG